MKGYTLNTTMYVFPQTAAEIPYVDETVTAIMVQQEDLAAWKTANSDYAAIMQPYNYNTMTVQKKVWADHLNDDIVVPTPPVTLYTVSLTNDAQTAAPDFVTALAEQNEFEEGDTVTLTQEFIDGETTDLREYYYTINNANAANFSYDPDPEALTDFTAEFTMPAADATVDIQAKTDDPGFFFTLDNSNPVSEALVYTLGADDNVFPTLMNTNSQSNVTYGAEGNDVSVNATTGEVTLLKMGGATVYAEGTSAPIYFNGYAYYELAIIGPYKVVLADATTEGLVTIANDYGTNTREYDGGMYSYENATITINVNENATISTISAVDKNNDPITLTQETGYYTFTMPASTVTITATGTVQE